MNLICIWAMVSLDLAFQVTLTFLYSFPPYGEQLKACRFIVLYNIKVRIKVKGIPTQVTFSLQCIKLTTRNLQIESVVLDQQSHDQTSKECLHKILERFLIQNLIYDNDSLI